MRIIPIVLSCLVLFGTPSNASEAGTFEAMVALAEKGNAEAQYHVGMMHNNGIGTSKSPAQAFEWFQKSAASGDPLGAYKVGCYYDGQGAGVVRPDAIEALRFKLISANAGYALAQNDVAVLYAKEGKPIEALMWWKMASSQGHQLALYNLSNAYGVGKLVPSDPSLAYAYLWLSKRAPQKTLDELESTLSKTDLQKPQKMLGAWSPQPTAVTLKAFGGVKAAEQLLESHR